MTSELIFQSYTLITSMVVSIQQLSSIDRKTLLLLDVRNDVHQFLSLATDPDIVLRAVLGDVLGYRTFMGGRMSTVDEKGNPAAQTFCSGLS